MNKFLLAISMVSAVTLATFDAADAQQRRQGNQYVNRGQINVYNNRGYNRPYNRPNYGYRGGNRYVQNNYYGGRGGYYGGGNGAAWAAGIGGLAIGAILGSALSQPAYGYPACQQVQISQRLVPTGGGGYYYAPIYAQQCY